MGFSPIPNNPENLEKKYYTSKKKIYPDGSWTCTHSLAAMFSDSAYNKFVDKYNNGDIAVYTNCDSDIDGFIDVDNFIDINDFQEVKSNDKEDSEKPLRLPRHDKNDVEHAIKRAKTKIFDICMCNEWAYFFTGTFGEKDLQSDPKKTLAKMRSWLNNQVKRRGLQYILVAEYTPINHLIHFHGLFNNAAFTYDFNDMYKVEGHKKPVKLKTLRNMGISPNTCKKVYNIREWEKSFGWCTAIKVYGNKVALSRYITKYITKENEKIFGKYYWSSKNIVREPRVEYFNISDEYFWNELPPDTFYIPFCELPFKYDCSFRVNGLTNETKRD